MNEPANKNYGRFWDNGGRDIRIVRTDAYVYVYMASSDGLFAGGLQFNEPHAMRRFAETLNEAAREMEQSR